MIASSREVLAAAAADDEDSGDGGDPVCGAADAGADTPVDLRAGR